MPLNNLPPVIQILIDEKIFNLNTKKKLQLKLSDKGFLKDLQSQAEWSATKFSYIDKIDSTYLEDFLLTPSSSMNPFSGTGKCSSISCLDTTTDKFAKFIGLYVDRAFVKDPFSGYFFEEPDFDDSFFIGFRHQIRAFNILFPLIESGIIQFASPFLYSCDDCRKKIKDNIFKISTRLLKDTKKEVEYAVEKFEEGMVVVVENPLDTTNEDHQLARIMPIGQADYNKILEVKGKTKQRDLIFKTLFKKLNNDLAGELREVLFDINLAHKTNSVFTAGSRLESFFITESDSIQPDITQIENWENSRAIDLPYIKELSIDEILILREEAKDALPKLRYLIGNGLKGNKGSTDTVVFEIVEELKSQLNEVQVEINSLSLSKERRYRFGASGLAMSFVIYGLVSGEPTITSTSIASLLATLAHLRNNERKCDSKMAQIQSIPAFTLLKAKHLLKARK